MNAVLVGVLVYIVVQLIIGVVVSRRINTEADYLIAGRSIGLGLATFSMFATWFGAETCIGAAGKFYEKGLAGGTTDPFGYTLALLLVGLVFAVPLWKLGLTTLADLFRQRYSTGVERFAALMLAPTSIFWAAAQIRAFGQVLHSASDLGVTAGITIAAVVVIIYTCTGGLFADVVTDLIQGIAIIIGLVFVLAVLGMSPEVNLAQAWRNLDPAKFQFFNAEESRWVVLELWALTLCGSVVAQELVARVLACKTPQVARNSALIGGGMYLAIGLIPAFLGLVGTQLLPGLENPEHILPELAEKYLPTFVFILFTGALVSAILSTVDSTLLAASSLVSHNFIVSFKPGMSDKQKLLLARGGVVLFGVIAYVLALGAESIFELVQQANGVGSSGIFVILVFGLFSKFGGAKAGMATLIVGLGTWVYGTYMGEWECTYLISLASALVTYVAVGLWERRAGPLPAAGAAS
ncbi:MAG: sodium:solute symporter family protein [Verrucomicrobiota bacterium]